MSNSGNVYKSNFIQITGENTRVIDSNALVAKRMEGFNSGILREQDQPMAEDEEMPSEPVYDEDGNPVEPDPMDSLTDGEFQAGLGAPEIEAPENPDEPMELSSDSVREECEEMIKKANAQAESIREEAKREAAEIMESAREEGFNKGKEEGLVQALEAKREFEAKKAELEAEYDEMLKKLEPQMVDVITSVYEHVFSNNFFSRRDVMVCLINKALMSIETDERVVILVSSEDYDMLVGMKSSLLEKVILKTEPEIVQRDDYQKGQVKIETPYGIIDCSIDTELKELNRTLRLLSYEGHGEV